MASHNTVLFFGPGRPRPHTLVSEFGVEHGLELVVVEDVDALHDLIHRGIPACVVLAGGDAPTITLELTRLLKSDPFTGIIPLVVQSQSGGEDFSAECLAAGADEVVSESLSEREYRLRLGQVLRRAERDVSVHPTTRLGGTVQIERDMARRLETGETFGVCYADLDHFKEFNDRYGYNHGDGVIRLLARILRDMVRGLAPGGFVGHIGGDDFIFNVPARHLEVTCDEIIMLFDELIPYQYTEEDRQSGYFLGKDRRGNIHRIPLMTLSIGVVTNQFQTFDHTAQISELAAEMKSYAKTLPGSVYVVDRRHTLPGLETASAGAPDALVAALEHPSNP